MNRFKDTLEALKSRQDGLLEQLSALEALPNEGSKEAQFLRLPYSSEPPSIEDAWAD